VARKSVELRREEILDATVLEIQRRGIAATRVADVAGALGVSSSLVFYHFAAKEQLLQAAFEYAARTDIDALHAACARRAPLPARFRAVLRIYGPTRRAPGWRLWIDAWGVGLREPRWRATVRRMDEEWRRCIAALVAEGVAAGQFSCPDADAAAWRITAFLDGAAVQLVARGGGPRRADITRWVHQHIARELGVDPSLLAARRAGSPQSGQTHIRS